MLKYNGRATHLITKHCWPRLMLLRSGCTLYIFLTPDCYSNDQPPSPLEQEITNHKQKDWDFFCLLKKLLNVNLDIYKESSKLHMESAMKHCLCLALETLLKSLQNNNSNSLEKIIDPTTFLNYKVLYL